jgi:hypothetical protein
MSARAKTCHLTTPTLRPPHYSNATTTSLLRRCDLVVLPMPKAVTSRKVVVIRGAPVDTTVKFKTVNRTRNKSGRAIANNVKTTLEFLPSDSTPPPSAILDPYSRDSETDDDEQIQPIAQKGPSRAVSVSPRVICNIDSRLSRKQSRLSEWVPLREEDLDELVRLDGLGGSPLACVHCQCPAQFRCDDCGVEDLICQPCLLTSHSNLPFHAVEVCSVCIKFMVTCSSPIAMERSALFQGTSCRTWPRDTTRSLDWQHVPLPLQALSTHRFRHRWRSSSCRQVLPVYSRRPHLPPSTAVEEEMVPRHVDSTTHRFHLQDPQLLSRTPVPQQDKSLRLL